MAELISQTYAGALFDLGIENGTEETYGLELSALSGTFRENPDLMRILKSPISSKEEKKNLLSSIFGGKISLHAMNFLKILVDKERIGYFEAIEKTYRELLNERKNIEEVTAVTAVAMTKEMKQALSEKLKMQTGKNIVLRNMVDEKVLGGVLLKIKNEQIDATVRTRLESLRAELSSIIAG